MNTNNLYLAIVTLNHLRFLLTRTIENRKHTVAKEDRLLIFLMKMKLGATFLLVFSLVYTEQQCQEYFILIWKN
jgi:hypothetical protein